MIISDEKPTKRAKPKSKIPVAYQKKFWSNVSGSYKIDTESLLQFLNDRGYYVFKPQGVKTLMLVHTENKIVKEVTAKEIRRVCWDYIESEYIFSDPDERKQVKSEFCKNQNPVSKNNLELLPQFNMEECRDSNVKSYLFFNDCVLEILSDAVHIKKYNEIEGIVFESDISRVNIIPAFKPDQKVVEIIKPEGEFYEFIKDLCKNDKAAINDNSLESLISIIGYLVHRYKDPTNAKAIIFMDSYIDGNANGGTGKGVLTKGIGYIRSAAFQDGKFFKSSDKFVLSNVTFGTRILVIDDVPKDFEFEKIFPLVTEKAVIERKYENKFEIPYEYSPKVVITTNYTVEGTGNSHKRRKIEFILAETFNSEYGPDDKFGHLLYLEWDNNEWVKFYLFIAYCVQEFLKKGIVMPMFNVAERKLKMEATPEFIQYVNQNVELGMKLNKKAVFEDFYSKNPTHFKIELNTFNSWLQLFAKAYGYKMHSTHSGPDIFFEYYL
jgi:hypothetical protein